MIEFAKLIAPLLAELDQICPIYEAVGIDKHLMPLFKKHGRFPNINVVRIDSDTIEGIHIGNASTGTATLFLHKCGLHLENVDGACPDCQLYRFAAAKELVHTMDPEKVWTSADDLDDSIVKNLLSGRTNANSQVRADGNAQAWALELLARFSHRQTMIGGMSIARAKANRDYSYVAASYGIPTWAVEAAYDPTYMDAMKSIREKAGLPLIGYDPTPGN